MVATGTKRADAQRNIAAILAAAGDCLGRDPGASTSEIAKAAGVGRVTLYGHFPSRAELVASLFDYVAGSEGLHDSLARVWDAPDAQPRKLFRETTKAWVEDLGEPHFLPDGSFLSRIGRIEVRTSRPEPPAPVPLAPAVDLTPALSLSDYLAARQTRQRSGQGRPEGGRR